METCCICGTKDIRRNREPDSVTSFYFCPRCGMVKCDSVFWRRISGVLSDYQKANACGWIRENEGYILQDQDVEFIKNIPTPTVEEKANKLLLYLVRNWPRPGEKIEILETEKAKVNEYLGVTWSASIDEYYYLVHKYLDDFNGFIRKVATTICEITPAGWEHITTLQAPNSESNIAFVAMRFSDEMKKIFYDVIRPAVLNCGFEPLIMFEKNHINKIDDEIIAGINKSRFLIADFTDQNQGAYYEAGFARGLGLKVISTCDKAEVDAGKLHFDTRQYRTILWEKDKINAFEKELQDCIEANIGTGKNKPIN